MPRTLQAAAAAHAGAGVPCRSPSLRAAAGRAPLPRTQTSTNQEDQTLTIAGLFSCPVYTLGWSTWFNHTAYGKQTITSATGAARSKSAVGWGRGFTGYVADNETGLLYAKARMYSPGLGIFIGRDPLGYVDGMSVYRAFFIPNNLDSTGTSCKEGMPISMAIKKYGIGACPSKENLKSLYEKEKRDEESFAISVATDVCAYQSDCPCDTKCALMNWKPTGWEIHCWEYINPLEGPEKGRKQHVITLTNQLGYTCGCTPEAGGDPGGPFPGAGRNPNMPF